MTRKLFYACALLLLNLRTEVVYCQYNFESPDSVVHHLYNLLSGPAGERNWKLYKSLFHEKAIQGATVQDTTGQITYRYFSPDGYVARNDNFFKTRGFYVKEIHSNRVQFGEIAHIFSTYQFQVYIKEQDAPLNGKGINSIQLIYNDGRWWIISIQWTNERPNLSIPWDYGG